MRKLTITSFLLTALTFHGYTVATPISITLSPFKVVKVPSSCKGSSTCSQDVLVPKNTTENQLKDLIVAISCAHRQHSLQLIGFSPTTPRSPYGPYFGVEVDIFDDPEQMKQSHLLLAKDLDSKTINSLYEKSRKNIKAHYSATDFSIKKGYERDDATIGVDGVKNPAFKRVELPALAACPTIILGKR